MRRYLQYWRVAGMPAEDPPTITPRKVTGWIMRRHSTLDERDRAQLDTVLGRSAEVATAHRLAAEFAVLLRELRSEELETWVQQAEHCEVREIRSFATTLRRDWDAVVAELTPAHSNGPTEGNVNRLKLVKRAMYGRANFDLLRRRVLART